MIPASNNLNNLNTPKDALLSEKQISDLTDFNHRFGNQYDTLSDEEKLEFYGDIKRDEAQAEIEKHYHALKKRTIELLGSGYSLQRLAIETEPQNINLSYYGAGKWQDILKTWLAGNYQTLRVNNRYMDKPSLAELVENALVALFSYLGNENVLTPIFVMISVSKKIFVGFEDTRIKRVLGEFITPPGSGKTYTANYYQSEMRKKEGFNCPVWIITLRQSNSALRHILLEIYYAMAGKSPEIENSHFKSIFDISLAIEKLALKNPNGIIIIDEAQTIFSGAHSDDHGLKIIDELRSFSDRGLFGIALLSNGEIYKHVKQSNANQLASRMEAYRVDAGKLKVEDIELIMQAYDVKGKACYDWSIKVGMGTSGLRALTTFYKKAMSDYGEISIDILNSFRQV